MSELCDALVIGAGPAGLAAAACLRERGLDPVILEKANTVGAVWRRHYDRLRLHTDRRHSALPGLPMPKAYGRYPSRVDVIDYLERYAARFGLKPQFGTQVRAIRRGGAFWLVEAGDKVISAPVVVVATGWADFPNVPSWPGLEAFGGAVLHLDDTFPHGFVRHGRGEYVNGAIHTQTIDGFWSLLKRGIIGSSHKVSRKYLPLYVAEFEFRYNNRDNPDIFGTAIGRL